MLLCPSGTCSSKSESSVRGEVDESDKSDEVDEVKESDEAEVGEAEEEEELEELEELESKAGFADSRSLFISPVSSTSSTKALILFNRSHFSMQSLTGGAFQLGAFNLAQIVLRNIVRQ